MAQVPSLEAARELAQRIGAPLLVKAAGGGGGRGMKLVERAEISRRRWSWPRPRPARRSAMRASTWSATSRAARHVEVQVLGDGAGNVVHLGERDCSVQRRYQKLIEETPAPGSVARSCARVCTRRRCASPRG